MLDVPPSDANRKCLVSVSQPRQRPERPPPSRCCQAPGWWNGWRQVFPVVARLIDGVTERWELWLALAKCSACRRGFTCYPAGIYPRRQYQFDVVASVVALVTWGRHSFARAGATVGACHMSARRWTGWVEQLTPPAELYAVAARLDPDAPAGATLHLPEAAPSFPVVAQVLSALEQLGLALDRLGIGLGARTGLGRVLGWQHQTHGIVVGLRDQLSGLSPPM